jgi:hypothetical protein
MGLNCLSFCQGDAANAVLVAAGYYFRRLIGWPSLLSVQILSALTFNTRGVSLLQSRYALSPMSRAAHYPPPVYDLAAISKMDGSGPVREAGGG